MSAERPKYILYRWTAQDVAGAQQKPAVIANPYGINPDEVFLASGKPPPDDKRWAARFTDGELVDLPTGKCRLPYMLEQFFVPDHVWEEAPPDLEAATIGELCQKLADRSDRYAIFAEFSSKAPAPKNAEAKRTLDARKRALAKKLFWYWKNTDYRWALLHSGVSLTTIDQAPETLAARATATPPGAPPISARLTWVLARAAPQKPVGVKPHPKKPEALPKITTIRLPAKPSWNADPAKDSPFADLPEDLRETVKRSFVDRMCAVPGASLNLNNAWTSEAQTAWDVLRRCSAQGVSLLVRTYRRIEGIDPSLKLWRQIRYLRNQWWGGSAGFKVVYESPPAVRAVLDGLFSATATPTVARDRFFYGLEHQRESSFDLAPQAADDNAELPDCDTWREVDKPKEEGVHFCVGKSDLPGHMATQARKGGEFFEADLAEPRQVSLDDIHVDWFSPVNGVDPASRKCNYLPLAAGSGTHWFQATMGIGKPTFYFSRVDKAVGDSPDRVGADFVKRWEADKWKLAVQGKAGNDGAKRYSDELDQILGR